MFQSHFLYFFLFLYNSFSNRVDLVSGSGSGTITIEIGCLTRLEYFRSKVGNQEGTIPFAIGNLTNLAYLSLFMSKLTGTIPTSIDFLNKLYFAFNELSGEILETLCPFNFEPLINCRKV
jgi:hypothetical protein